MNTDLRLVVNFVEVELLLKREHPGVAWPSGKPIYWQRFSFPVRCWEEVVKLGRQCAHLPAKDRAAHIESRRRAILWN
jgi:hypothetical protein